MKRRDLMALGVCGALGSQAMGGERPAVGGFEFETVTQQLIDAIAPGEAAVWAARLHPDFISTDENGIVSDREAFLVGMQPLPAGVSGDLRLIDFRVRTLGETAIATYVIDEVERYHGEVLRCQYRNTDTWVRTAAGWRLAATQEIALRKDPPAVPLKAAQWAQYAGRYGLADGMEIEVLMTAGGATMRRGSGLAKPLRAETPDVLFIPGEPRYRYIARRDLSGAVASLAERREAWDIVWVRRS